MQIRNIDQNMPKWYNYSCECIEYVDLYDGGSFNQESLIWLVSSSSQNKIGVHKKIFMKIRSINHVMPE